jgi:AcrR family transcriptional regulator
MSRDDERGGRSGSDRGPRGRARNESDRGGRGRGRSERGRSGPDEPIWARPEPTGRRAPRSREDIAEAAIAVADAEGLDAVSMRRVAAELGLGTMSLYHYVRSKDELLDLMGDGIMAGQLVDDADLQRGWRVGLTAIAHATRRNFERHPWLGEAMRPRQPTIPGPNATRHVDQSIAAVADIDAELQTKMDIIAVVDDYVIGFVQRMELSVDPREGARGATEEWVEAVFDHLRQRLDTGSYPHLQAALDEHVAEGGSLEDLARMTSDERRFERGLQFLLDGIEVELSRQAGTARRRRGR